MRFMVQRFVPLAHEDESLAHEVVSIRGIQRAGTVSKKDDYHRTKLRRTLLSQITFDRAL